MTKTFFKAQIPSVTLYSGLSASGTSMRITPVLTDLDGNVITMAALQNNPQLTIDPKISGYEEIIGFTGIINNGDNTMTLTGLSRDLASSSLATPGTGKQHGAGAVVVLSLNPQDVARLGALENDETITGDWHAPTPAGDDSIANKKYVDDTASFGAPLAATSTAGLVQQATQAQADAKTDTGSTGAKLIVTPAEIRASNINDYVALDTGAADAYAIATNPVITAYAEGQVFIFKATNANTTASTLAVCSLATKPIKKNHDVALVAGDIEAGQTVVVVYDGTNMQMISPNGHDPASLYQLLSNLDTTVTLGASDTKYPSQNAVKTYVDSNHPVVKTGIATRAGTTASGSQTIAHGLGRIPKVVRISAQQEYVYSNNSPVWYHSPFSKGLYDGTNTSCLYVGIASGNTNPPVQTPLNSTTYIVYINHYVGGNNGYQRATISVDITNITLTWTYTDAGSAAPLNAANIDLMWEVE